MQHNKSIHTATHLQFSDHGPSRNGSFMYRADVETKLYNILNNVDKIPKHKISSTATLSELNLNDLDQMELLVTIENEFVIDLENNEAANIYTVKQLIDTITNHPFAM